MQYAQPDPENLVYFDQYFQGDKNAFKNLPDFEKIQGNLVCIESKGSRWQGFSKKHWHIFCSDHIYNVCCKKCAGKPSFTPRPCHFSSATSDHTRFEPAQPKAYNVEPARKRITEALSIQCCILNAEPFDSQYQCCRSDRWMMCGQCIFPKNGQNR